MCIHMHKHTMSLSVDNVCLGLKSQIMYLAWEPCVLLKPFIWFMQWSLWLLMGEDPAVIIQRKTLQKNVGYSYSNGILYK